MDTQLLRYSTLPPIPRITPVSSERVAPGAGADPHPCALTKSLHSCPILAPLKRGLITKREV